MDEREVKNTIHLARLQGEMLIIIDVLTDSHATFSQLAYECRDDQFIDKYNSFIDACNKKLDWLTDEIYKKAVG